jgi:endonuclease/exonuclease/phosphatase family metal-dependent hydrolase
MARRVQVATCNLHAGIDAWGRRFDARHALAALDADVLLLQECWTDEGASSTFVEEVAHDLGGESREVPLARGRRAEPHPNPPAAWYRRRSYLDGDHSLYLDQDLPYSKKLTGSPRYRAASPGTFSLGVVSKYPILESVTIPLGRLPRDRVHRSLLVVRLDVEGAELQVICTHMTHLTYGSPKHFATLRRITKEHPALPTVIGGDMNLWGPLVQAQLPGFSRAIKTKTWPAWKPHSHVDHLLVNDQVRVVRAEVGAFMGSDHLPVRAAIEFD